VADNEPSAPAPKAGGGFNATKLILCLGVVLIAGGMGYGVALLSGGKPAEADAATVAAGKPGESATETPAKAPPAKESTSKEKGKDEFTYYDFEPIVVNLDEPRLARYIRITLTLAIRAENLEAAKAILDKKKPELKNWVTTFFSSCTLDQVRGAANLNRLRREILDAFSQQLWPDQKPLIDHILFKEFAVS
jgi:flagellar basal body-associated protein FliL